MEAGLDQTPPPAAKKRLTVFGSAARRKRMFARLKEGWADDGIAREKRVTSKRVRQIVKEVLQRPDIVESDHALLRLSRLGPALRAAGGAVARGNVKIAALMNVLDRLDRRQKVAQADRIED